MRNFVSISSAPSLSSTKGFTIIELMVASTVFSVVVLSVAYGIMGISKQYQRSMNISRTQAAARVLLDSTSEGLKFSDGSGSVGNIGQTSYDCRGSKIFIFTPGRKKIIFSGTIGPTDTRNAVLIKRVLPGYCSPPGSDIYNQPLLPGAEELLGINMRLAWFKIAENPVGSGLYKISVKVAYGDDDLLCSETAVPGSCNAGAPDMPANRANFYQADLRCKPGAGSEYCAVSGLSTTVGKRL